MARKPDEDRTVHGQTVDGADIVRYDRAGKWFVEPTDGSKRHAVSIAFAAELAAAGRAFHDLAGGRAFNRRVRQLRG